LLHESPSSGVGWHEQYNSWNKSNHSCPGSVRERQIREVIIPRLAGGTTEEDELDATEKKQLAEARDFAAQVRNFIASFAKATGDAEPTDAGSFGEAGTKFGEAVTKLLTPPSSP
jgi:hypothetical protein